jgi:DNA polymerase-3 subunit epsilon
VYLFKGPRAEVLYVGTSKNIRRRVRSYFTKAEKRRRITEMVRIATEVTAVVCATELEAAVRELRLITSHAPRYNRRSVHPERQIWVRLTDMPHPRLQLVQQVCEGSAHIGPFTSRRTATEAVAAIRAADALTAETLQRDPSPVVTALATRIGRLAAEERFEEAGAVTERLRAFLHGAARAQHFAPLAACAELVAAHPTPSGGWELIVVRHGRLVATAVSLPGGDPWPVIAALRATAEVVDPPTPPAPACHPEETALILQWLDAPGTRLVHISEPWAMPLRSAAAHTHAAGLARAVGSQIGVPEPSGS